MYDESWLVVEGPPTRPRPRAPPPRENRARETRTMSAEAEPSAYGAETFANGHWYHELLEDGLALSYRVRKASDE